MLPTASARLRMIEGIAWARQAADWGTYGCRGVFQLQILVAHQRPGAQAALVQLQGPLEVQHALHPHFASERLPARLGCLHCRSWRPVLNVL